MTDEKGKDSKYIHSEITDKIIHECYYIYNNLGSGFLEKVYENTLVKSLTKNGLIVSQQYSINVYFEGDIVGE